MHFIYFWSTLLTAYFFLNSSILAMMDYPQEGIEDKIQTSNQRSPHKSDDKEHIMLIHGAWHGAWCWEKVTPFLLKNNYTVHLPNLPGHGDNPCQLQEVTLKKYVDYIIEQVSFIDKPVNLVGHSMGGVVISQVAEIIPEKVKSLTYLTSFLLKNNESLMDAAGLEEKELVPVNMTDNGLGMQIKEGTLIETFYDDCSTEVLGLYLSKLLDRQATAPMTTPIQVSKSRFGSVPRAYIECTKDRAISIKRQRAMQKDWPCKVVSTLEASHSPFFSAPIELANALDYVIKKMQ